MTEGLINLSKELEDVGLIWQPRLGDEVVLRDDMSHVSVINANHDLNPHVLRSAYLWLPRIEQLIAQIEARQGLICHAGINSACAYEIVVKFPKGFIEVYEWTFRTAFALAVLRMLLYRDC
ncbi:MAG: hypothetical protein PHC51_01670 [bacterium]|nr:hypothetical protein [bacterium]